MICGKPLIVNKDSSTARIVKEVNCGIVIDGENIEEIRNAIIKLKNNPELCNTLGNNGRIAYENKYSWEIMSKNLLNLYEKIIQNTL